MISLSDIIKALNYRYATKVFDLEKKVSSEDFEELLEVLRLTPSSYGLQAWKFIIVNDVEKRKLLAKASYGQNQVSESSHLIALCAKTSFSDADVLKYVELMAKERGTTVDKLKGFSDMLKGSISSRNEHELISWNKKQTYIALGFLMEAAALKGIDTCPMEGFDSKEVDKILSLKEKGLTIATLCPIGYRSDTDKNATIKKVRFSKSHLVETI